MTIEIDAGTLGTIQGAMSHAAAERGADALKEAEKGNVVKAFFYAEWAAHYAKCVIEIQESQKRAWGEL